MPQLPPTTILPRPTASSSSSVSRRRPSAETRNSAAVSGRMEAVFSTTRARPGAVSVELAAASASCVGRPTAVSARLVDQARRDTGTARVLAASPRDAARGFKCGARDAGGAVAAHNMPAERSDDEVVEEDFENVGPGHELSMPTREKDFPVEFPLWWSR